MLVTCGSDLLVWKSRAVKTSVRKEPAHSASSSVRLAANLWTSFEVSRAHIYLSLGPELVESDGTGSRDGTFKKHMDGNVRFLATGKIHSHEMKFS